MCWPLRVALRGMGIVDVPLSEAVGTQRTLDLEFMREAAEFFKCDQSNGP